MEELDFENDGTKPKKYSWVKFSENVIPFLADESAKKLVRSNYKVFE
jgi:hypothetical protein